MSHQLKVLGGDQGKDSNPAAIENVCKTNVKDPSREKELTAIGRKFQRSVFIWKYDENEQLIKRRGFKIKAELEPILLFEDKPDHYQSLESLRQYLSEESARIIDENLRDKDFERVNVAGNGSCFYRCVSRQMYGNDTMHNVIRGMCANYMQDNYDRFKKFTTDEDYFSNALLTQTYAAGDVETVPIISEIFKRPIELWYYNGEITVYEILYNNTKENPIRLLFLADHKRYQSIEARNPWYISLIR